ncbi:hypothetical protein Y032_0006g2812 [Ancylostoma ceylanicum]|uniref:Uncharacterized protein n=1 Tax=Ancylostoma ceylanicum TaxID=53326 RepID=A0A016VP18_9BILA|nr:hypothetical protein Y032_0006g2812 [Ancylostoma ceylanicum]
MPLSHGLKFDDVNAAFEALVEAITRRPVQYLEGSTVGVDVGDSSAASKCTRRDRAARAGIPFRTTNYWVFLTIRQCSNDSIVSGAVWTRVFRRHGCVTAIDAHCAFACTFYVY